MQHRTSAMQYKFYTKSFIRENEDIQKINRTMGFTKLNFQGLLGPKKELWDLLQKVELLDTEAQDITASVRDLPTVR